MEGLPNKGKVDDKKVDGEDDKKGEKRLGVKDKSKTHKRGGRGRGRGPVGFTVC